MIQWSIRIHRGKLVSCGEESEIKAGNLEPTTHSGSNEPGDDETDTPGTKARQDVSHPRQRIEAKSTVKNYTKLLFYSSAQFNSFCTE